MNILNKSPADAMADLGKSTQSNSEAGVVLLAPFFIWILNTKLQLGIPMDALGSLLVFFGVLAARVRQRIEIHDKLAMARALGRAEASEAITDFSQPGQFPPNTVVTSVTTETADAVRTDETKPDPAEPFRPPGSETFTPPPPDPDRVKKDTDEPVKAKRTRSSGKGSSEQM